MKHVDGEGDICDGGGDNDDGDDDRGGDCGDNDDGGDDFFNNFYRREFWAAREDWEQLMKQPYMIDYIRVYQ